VSEHDWSPLSERDPVPGDFFAVHDLSTHFAEQAERIRDVVKALQRVDAGDIKSTAVDAIVERRDAVIPNLGLLADRYENTADALRPYSYALERAKELAEQSRTKAWDAHQRLIAAQQALQAAAANPPAVADLPAGPRATPAGPVRPADLPFGPFDTPAGPFTPAAPDPEEQLRQARADLAAAQSLLDEAIETRDRAAARAIGLLDDANHDELKNPDRGFFAPLGDMVDSIVKLPATAATLAAAAVVAPVAILSDPIGSVAGVANWVGESFSSWENISNTLGLVGGAIGIAGLMFTGVGALAVAGLAVGALKLGTDTYLAATGQGSWGEVALGALGLAAFGAARIAAQAQRTAVYSDATDAATRLRSAMASTSKGFSAAKQAKHAENLQRLRSVEHIARMHKGDAVAKGFLPRMSSWGRAVLHGAEAPTAAALKVSPSAQKIARISTALEWRGRVDDAVGGAEVAATVANKAEPTVREWVP
jgi:hypothetical protein